MNESAVINGLAAAGPTVGAGAAVHTWHDANRRHLAAVLSTVYRRLEAVLCAEEVPQEETDAQSDWADSTEWPFDTPPALQQICSALQLSNFEQAILLMAAGPEFDSRFSEIYKSIGNNGSLPNFAVALNSFPDAHWSALTPARPLRHFQLIHVLTAETLVTSAFRIDESILHYLAGAPAPDPLLRHILQQVPSPRSIPPSYHRLAESIATMWLHSGDPTESSTRSAQIELCGDNAEANRTVAAVAAALIDRGLFAVDLRSLGQLGVSDAELLIRLCEREVLLNDGALLLEVRDPISSETAQVMERIFHSRTRAPTVISGPIASSVRSAGVRFYVGRPTRAEQATIWGEMLSAVTNEAGVDAITAQFNLYPGAIDSAARKAMATAPRSETASSLASKLWDACKTEARPQLEALAQRIEPVANWGDLVLPSKECAQLGRIATHLRQRTRVYESWGFGRNGSRGFGISALFAGPSGTGKTLAAEVLASDLNLDLFRIDLSQIVSKYIGETEKNLSRVFDAADHGGAILLFDEADALFGRRSEVKDSHDRYANIEVSYLLQRMESYRGLAILTTNRKSALDPAFLRRLRFIVEFQFPEAAQRAEIWRRVFPPQTPVDRLDFERLGQLRISGAYIHNIALSAAFLAADASQSVRMEHIAIAIRAEFAKLEMPLTETEIAGWV